MATFFNGNSEIQGDGLQTLILMNPSYVGYSPDTQSPQQGSFVFLNSTPVASGATLATGALVHAPPSQAQQFVGIPHPSQPSVHVHPQHHDLSALHHPYVPRVQYNMYSPVELAPPRDVTRSSQQGLSLTLSSQQTGYVSQSPAAAISPANPGDGGKAAGVGSSASASASGVSNGVNGVQSVLLNSKYLKATQELLEEVVNVGKGILKSVDQSPKRGVGQSRAAGGSPSATGDGNSGEVAGKRAAELTTAERQEIQMKKAKLVNMLSEVEQRYRKYHNQMQMVIMLFEQAAGVGSAKTYTALALDTISKQFRCLKDAIMGQIKAASKSLGEEDGFGKVEGDGAVGSSSSRLKFVDNQLRQQRALQQLGMMQHNAWRPQRGLPERSVSVLRAWLFEHFLHPYPKDSDKLMLAKQTGLTRSQVSNWFINARVRLWKPMVEEMYLEEIKDQEHNGSPVDKIPKPDPNNYGSPSKSSPAQQRKILSVKNPSKALKPKQDNPATPISNALPHPPPAPAVSTTPIEINFQNHAAFSLIGSSEMDGISHFSPKKHRSHEILHSKPSEANCGPGGMLDSPTDFMGGLGSYPIGEIGRFAAADHFQPPYSGNSVSLTLGLPHCDSISLSGPHQGFLHNQTIQLGRGVEIGGDAEFGAINTTPYETINLQSRKRFAAQLLPDFVA